MYVQYTFEAHVVGMQHLHRPNNTIYLYRIHAHTLIKVYQQINILLLAIPSGMKIIFQPSCFHTIRNIASFVRKQRKTQQKLTYDDDNNK